MKYWILFAKSKNVVEPPNFCGIYMSKEDADKALEVETEVWGDEADEYEIATVIVPLSTRR